MIVTEHHALAACEVRGPGTEDHVRRHEECQHDDCCNGPHDGVRYARHATPGRGNGSTWIRLPVAAKMALATAGPTGATPGSPTPVGAAFDGTIYTSTVGISFMRRTR